MVHRQHNMLEPAWIRYGLLPLSLRVIQPGPQPAWGYVKGNFAWCVDDGSQLCQSCGHLYVSLCQCQMCTHAANFVMHFWGAGGVVDCNGACLVAAAAWVQVGIAVGTWVSVL